MQDGTKITARASSSSFDREKTLREHLEQTHSNKCSVRDAGAEAAAKRRRQAARERAPAQAKQEQFEKHW